MQVPANISAYLPHIRRIQPSSHKGQNGKVLVIGGSELFHSASRWALDIVSAMVDMVFYSSVPINNELIKQAKGEFWDGVVVPRGELESYVQEADVVLIGPGMTRNEQEEERVPIKFSTPTPKQWQEDTYAVTNYLLSQYPNKKWVIDAGALQMVEPKLLNRNCILTPHQKEFLDLTKRVASYAYEKFRVLEPKEENSEQRKYVDLGVSHFTIEAKSTSDWLWNEEVFEDYLHKYMQELSRNDPETEWILGKIASRFYEVCIAMNGATLLRKGQEDFVAKMHFRASEPVLEQTQKGFEIIGGGNPGMTKGGTGDVLAGLVAGLYAFSDDPFAAAVVGSFVNKTAGDQLYKRVGPFFKTSALVKEIPLVLYTLLYP